MHHSTARSHPRQPPCPTRPPPRRLTEQASPDPVFPAVVAVRDRPAQEKNVSVCTVRPDGSPHVTPVWFDFLQSSWWISADGGSVRSQHREVLAGLPGVPVALTAEQVLSTPFMAVMMPKAPRAGLTHRCRRHRRPRSTASGSRSGRKPSTG
ncbi:pyridoxamine 5'-phosphate oxidase family protein [Streptomyces sp. NPDC005329]|uniref:pyridoxamine 5'-phosphate oxidase family protein n=1 Tax=Streptomyces sp. NPDC005329 TaxID=3157034 RepID=UPI0033A82F42